MTEPMTDVKIRSLVRRQLIAALQDDLDGGELLTKEVWEQCETTDHQDAARRELVEIITAYSETRRVRIRHELVERHLQSASRAYPYR